MQRDGDEHPQSSGDGGSPERPNRADELDPDAYLERLGIDPASVEGPDLATLERVQRAHVRTVPFENLSIVGDPFGDRDGEGVVLSIPHLYEKIVERERGGYCFELNGLCNWLLEQLGYDVHRVAARVTSGTSVELPANHHANVVSLDREYVVDVGMGTPQMSRPVPLDGEPCEDTAGIEWHIAESERPDATHRAEFRRPDEREWSRRYVFSHVPRDFDYFRATNDYLQSAPESPFTGTPVVSIATEEGYRRLSNETLTEYRGGDERERAIPPDAWTGTLEREFGLRYDE